MSQVSLKFLTDSILLDPSAQANYYSSLSDRQLLDELMAYRKHVKDRWEKLNRELVAGRGKLGAYFGTSLVAEPKYEQLMRASLYFDQLLVKDPLIPHGRETSHDSEVMEQFLGIEYEKLDRQATAEAAYLVSRLLPLVRGGIVKLVPSSLEHEPPKEVSFTYSPNLFSERVPEPLLSWFYDQVEVLPVRRRSDGVLELSKELDLVPCNDILVCLGKLSQEYVFHNLPIIEQRILPNGELTLRFQKPAPDQRPSPEEFQIWVRQSVNQASGYAFRRIASDLRVSAACDTMMFTDSQGVADLLRLRVTKNGRIDEDLATLALQFELPFLDRLTADDLMVIRRRHGEAFEGFRFELRRQLRELRGIKSQEDLRHGLENIQHDITEMQVRRIQTETRQLRGHLFREAVIGVASFATVIASQGLSFAPLWWAANEAWKHSLEYREIKRNPAFFVWQLQKRTK